MWPKTVEAQRSPPCRAPAIPQLNTSWPGTDRVTVLDSGFRLHLCWVDRLLQSLKKQNTSARRIKVSYLICRGFWRGCCTCSAPQPRRRNAPGCVQRSTWLHVGNPGNACWSVGLPRPGKPTEKQVIHVKSFHSFKSIDEMISNWTVWHRFKVPAQTAQSSTLFFILGNNVQAHSKRFFANLIL